LLLERIDELTAIDGHIWQDFLPDSRQWVYAAPYAPTLVQRRHDFAQGFGDVQLNVPHFLIGPGLQLPLRQIKALGIPPGLGLQQ
jgi:hypothetical protein